MKSINYLLGLVLISFVTACTHMEKEKSMEDVINTAFQSAMQQYTLMAEALAENDSLLPKTYADYYYVETLMRYKKLILEA